MNRYIRVSDSFEGFHAYKDAPDEVAFLRHNHRHLFKLYAMIEVFHDDRELEFIMVKEQLKRSWGARTLTHAANLGSCEQIAEAILNSLKEVYGRDRRYVVEVYEDDENGAVVEYDPQTDNSVLSWTYGLR